MGFNENSVQDRHLNVIVKYTLVTASTANHLTIMSKPMKGLKFSFLLDPKFHVPVL